jgi:FMN phosphatase YigB (HAD superfamily)
MTTLPKIELLVTDLDNTLYDWISFFVPAFYAMVKTGARLLGISEEQLLNELREVHQHRGNSEHPFALLETASAQRQLGRLSFEAKKAYLDRAFHDFNRHRKNSLKLYDGVVETLLKINASGVPIVAHTDALIENSLFRMMKLGLIGLIERLYAPRSAYERSNKTIEAVPVVQQEYTRLLPPEERKPNPKVLLDICKDYSVKPSSTLYVGDSLVRDIYMANLAGTRVAWARYGTIYDRNLWPLLVRVTHWTSENVEREKELKKEARNAHPDVVLSSFPEVLHCFRFGRS